MKLIDLINELQRNLDRAENEKWQVLALFADKETDELIEDLIAAHENLKTLNP